MKIILVKSGRCQMYLHYYSNINCITSEILNLLRMFPFSVAAPVCPLLCQPGVSSVSCLLDPGGSYRYHQTLTWKPPENPLKTP